MDLILSEYGGKSICEAERWNAQGGLKPHCLAYIDAYSGYSLSLKKYPWRQVGLKLSVAIL